MLLNLEQFKQLVPGTLASYIQYGTLILYEVISVPIADISGVCEAPLSLLQWDGTTLHQVTQEV